MADDMLRGFRRLLPTPKPKWLLSCGHIVKTPEYGSFMGGKKPTALHCRKCYGGSASGNRTFNTVVAPSNSEALAVLGGQSVAEIRSEESNLMANF